MIRLNLISNYQLTLEKKTRLVKTNLTLRVSGNYGEHKVYRQFLKLSFLWNIGLTIKNKNTKNVKRFCWENPKFNRKRVIFYGVMKINMINHQLWKSCCGGGRNLKYYEKLLNCLILPSSKLENVSILDSFIENLDTCQIIKQLQAIL